MIVTSIQNIKSQPLFFEFNNFIFDSKLYLKLEGLNIAGSIKLKTAKFLIDGLEQLKQIERGKSIIIESSSGNLGLALALICKERNYEFVCVIDPNILPEKEKLLRLYGAKIIKVTVKDTSGGYLSTRIKTIENILQSDKRYVWTNQYKNIDNIYAHYHETAREIFDEIKEVDYLFVGAGTTGTLMGCAQYCREFSPQTKIIAVDAAGSVTFGGKPASRYIPGLGTSRRPELVDQEMVDEVVFVEEVDTIKMCRYLLDTYGLFVGGSTGSVLHAIQSYSGLKKIDKGATVVSISPDFGYPYADSIFDDSWVSSKFYAGEKNVV